MNQKREHLKAWVNRILEDQPKDEKIEKRLLFRPAGITSEEISSALEEWKNKNYLVILKKLDECQDNEACIRMLRFIDQPSPIKGYLNQT